MFFSAAHMLLFYLHMGYPMLLQGAQHKQKKAQIMEAVDAVED